MKAPALHIFWHRLRFSQAQTASQAYQALPLQERQRVDRLISPLHQQQALASFWARRLVLGQLLQADPSSLQFEQGPQGRPSLAGQFAGCCCFNLSHSEDWSVLVVSQSQITGQLIRLGVDVELPTRSVDCRQLAPRFFEPEEVETLRRHQFSRSFFFQIWTAKEAYIKSIGLGLHKPLDSFRVARGPGMLSQVEDLEGCDSAAYIIPISFGALEQELVTHLVIEHPQPMLQHQVLTL